jgi:nitrogen fixation/metabolism regulation signal transduction histidine kinase
LLRNAAEAVLELAEGNGNHNGAQNPDAAPAITLSWTAAGEYLVISIADTGSGLMNPGNAFVPFYTTKPSGSGIGLVLSRQIAEAHGGSLELSNRSDHRGCVVRISLPLIAVPQTTQPSASGIQ